LEDVGIDGKGWEGVDWIHLARTDWWQALEYVKGMKFLRNLSIYWLLKKDSPP
jgi:hypothetical protein